MAKRYILKKWKDKGSKVKLIYPRMRSFYVSKEDLTVPLDVLSAEKCLKSKEILHCPPKEEPAQRRNNQICR